jgi:hypothetical protein
MSKFIANLSMPTKPGLADSLPGQLDESSRCEKPETECEKPETESMIDSGPSCSNTYDQKSISDSNRAGVVPDTYQGFQYSCSPVGVVDTTMLKEGCIDPYALPSEVTRSTTSEKNDTDVSSNALRSLAPEGNQEEKTQAKPCRIGISQQLGESTHTPILSQGHRGSTLFYSPPAFEDTEQSIAQPNTWARELIGQLRPHIGQLRPHLPPTRNGQPDVSERPAHTKTPSPEKQIDNSVAIAGKRGGHTIKVRYFGLTIGSRRLLDWLERKSLVSLATRDDEDYVFLVDQLSSEALGDRRVCLCGPEYMLALSTGRLIVSSQWLEGIHGQGCRISPEPFEIQGCVSPVLGTSELLAPLRARVVHRDSNGRSTLLGDFAFAVLRKKDGEVSGSRNLSDDLAALIAPLFETSLIHALIYYNGGHLLNCGKIDTQTMGTSIEDDSFNPIIGSQFRYKLGLVAYTGPVNEKSGGCDYYISLKWLYSAVLNQRIPENMSSFLL